ncbi:MAG: pilus assembly protein PilE [SAR86 cluster bacterium]|uniref:Pilus assembly protein PilE n=1 Tax=SAR86 cluster bacterium TaxID=2030880 RepID=A0A2A4WWI3_9GAMM|nr:MAG: pilus assembly protein PilE [SAR86 cluster bacterium]
MQHTKLNGFTLLELLIVVAIMGILASIALPAYQNSVLRSARAEAKTELLQVASDQERHFSNFNTYVDDATPLNTPVVAGRDRTTQNAFYAISVAACAGGAITNCFLATATAQNDQTADACTTLTVSNTGARGATGDTTNECWQR